MYADSFKINIKDHLLRKQNYKNRIDAMLGFLADTKNCRSVLIGNYFNDAKIQACGICDNCINNKTDILTDEEFRIISERIISVLKTGPQSVNGLENELKKYKKNRLWKVINFLRAENIIVTDIKGDMILN
jgi:ATP-dependent DNA helicase RecQ